MIDLTWTKTTVGLVLFFTILYLLFVFLYYKKYAYKPQFQHKKLDIVLAFYAFILILIVAPNEGSDWFSYQEHVWQYDFKSLYQHYEPIYGVIIGLVNKNYLLFRIIVWGGAFLLTCYAFKRFKVNRNLGIFFIITVFLLTFNYARSTLGMSCYCVGLSLLLKPTKGYTLINYLFALFFFFCAYSFHHSLLILVGMTFAIFLPLDRPVIIIAALLLVPTAAAIMYGYFELAENLGDEDVSEKLRLYEEVEKASWNLNGTIRYAIQYGAFYFPIIVNTIAVIKNKNQLEAVYIRINNVILATVLASTAFLFMGFDNLIFVYRILFMTMIPSSILTVFLYQNKFLKRRMYTAVLLWGVAGTLFPLLYGIYIIK
jgi:hypothetical protein